MIKKLFLIIGGVILFALLSHFGYEYFYGQYEQHARDNLEKCAQLTVGIAKDDVVRTLGEPIAVHENEYLNELLLMFETPRIKSEMIQVRLDKKTQKVSAIKCTEGDDWK